jgi:hypothetical protein
LKLRLFIAATLLYCSTSLAKVPEGLGIFVKQEINATDKISSVGMFQRINFAYSDLGAEATTNISYAEVVTEDGDLEEYMAWEMGIKFGYFSDVFFYVEAGIDLSETLLNDSRNDNCCSNYYEQTNSPDGYAGVGFGFQLKKARIEFSTRARKIDSDVWQSEAYLFYGAQLTIEF